jgi:DNA polymerase elongation subunit (family B)
MAYRNIYFCRKHSTIHLWNYQPDGTPVKNEYFFKPYLYLPAADPTEAQMTGIDGVPLVKKEFNYEWERRKFVDGYKGTVYFNLPPTQQYLLENYHHMDINDLTRFPLRTFFFDIEVIADEFPTASESKFPITSITIYDTETKKYYVWGIQRYDEYSCKDHLEGIEPEEIVYEYCADEKYLLVKFLKFWRKNFPDLIVGYNSSSFDVVYIVGRIEKVLGEGKSLKLSPVDSLYGKEMTNKFGQTYQEYTIGGISHLDYMTLYKTFTPGERESDALDYVCREEIGVGKLDYSGESLNSLSDRDWNKFINYNIWDVKLMLLLDDKRKYLEIAKFSAFSGFCNIDKALGKVAIITGVLAKQGLDDGKIITTQEEGEHELIPGGFVKFPKPGMYESVTSIDLNSLYPNVIITLNISPETKMAKVVRKVDDDLTLYLFKDRKYVTIKKNQLNAFAKKNGWALSASGVLFDQREQSVCSKFVDGLYQKRKAVKARMLKLEAEKNPDTKLISQLDTEQYLYKILLNSTYGVLANRFFALYDIDCAKSITMTGQALIKESEKMINDIINTKYELDFDHVCAGDTDSLYLTLVKVLEKLDIKISDEDGNLTPEFEEIENYVVDSINRGVTDWAKNKLNSFDPRFEFKRESICPKAIWVGKKHYILRIINKEGVKMDKIKYSGLSVVKATFSDQVKAVTKGIVKEMMADNTKSECDAMFIKEYENFNSLETKYIATRSSMKVLDKWGSRCVGLKAVSGCPRHAKWSVYYNYFRKDLGLEHKYPEIEDGKKIKLVYVQPNKYNIEGIAYLDEFPTEFGLVPDKKKMFEICVVKCLQPIYEAIGWKIPNPEIQHENTIAELFG